MDAIIVLRKTAFHLEDTSKKVLQAWVERWLFCLMIFNHHPAHVLAEGLLLFDHD
jgi:hypothetical protein